jgi:hypothetical protein
MTSPVATEEVVRDCAEAGVKRVWMYRASGAGAVSSQAVDYGESGGIGVTAGEHPMMFFKDTGLLHTAGWLHR